MQKYFLALPQKNILEQKNEKKNPGSEVKNNSGRNFFHLGLNLKTELEARN